MALPAPGDAGNAALCAKYKIQAHYLAHACFLGTHALVRAAANLRGVPVAMIHGSLDRVCRPRSAWRIHRACAGSKLAWAQGAGHDPYHPAMQALLSSAAACFAEHGDFSRWPEPA
jgi:proline iminopeptidase